MVGSDPFLTDVEAASLTDGNQFDRCYVELFTPFEISGDVKVDKLPAWPLSDEGNLPT